MHHRVFHNLDKVINIGLKLLEIIVLLEIVANFVVVFWWIGPIISGSFVIL